MLLDASMPGLNGAQTLTRLRAFAPELPVLLCSGYSAAESRRFWSRSRTSPF